MKQTERLWLDALSSAQENKGAEVNNAHTSYSIVGNVIDNDGNVYENVVMLETDIFNGLKEDEWMSAVDNWINQHAG